MHRDVVILGAGGAGLATAARACELGLSVAVLEHADHIGGTTSLAVGSIAAAASHPDSPDLHAWDIAGLTSDEGLGHTELLGIYVRSVPATLAWLRSLGVHFLGPVHDDGSSIPRLYNALPHSGIYVNVLAQRVKRVDGYIQTGFTATHLIHEDGRVVGVAGRRRDEQEVVYWARRAIVMATGDFSGNDLLKLQHLGTAYPPVNRDNDGSGLELALGVGGVMARSPGRAGWPPELRFVAPTGRSILRRVPPSRTMSRILSSCGERAPRRAFGKVVSALSTTYLAPSPTVQEHGAVLLNGKGMRVAWVSGFDNGLEPGENYALVFDRSATQAFKTPGVFVSTAPGIAYASLSDYCRFRKDLWHHCATVEEVAGRIWAPAERVVDALAGRSGPFVLLGPARAVQILTDGGLDVDESLRVVTDQGVPVPGLYAAGAAGQSSLVLPGHGNHLGWALTSGRLVAEYIHRHEGGNR